MGGRKEGRNEESRVRSHAILRRKGINSQSVRTTTNAPYNTEYSGIREMYVRIACISPDKPPLFYLVKWVQNRGLIYYDLHLRSAPPPGYGNQYLTRSSAGEQLPIPTTNVRGDQHGLIGKVFHAGYDRLNNLSICQPPHPSWLNMCASRVGTMRQNKVAKKKSPTPLFIFIF